MQQAANIIDATFTANVTINIAVHYGIDANGNTLTTGAEGGPHVVYGVSYSNFRTALTNAANNSAMIAAAASLPAGTSVNGYTNFAIASAEAKALGLIQASSAVDGEVWMGSGIPSADLTGVALHELTHAMGRIDGWAGSNHTYPFVMDLFRFSGSGQRYFGTSTSTAAYFSINGGASDLADFGIYSDQADFLNPPSSNLTPADAFNEYYNSQTKQTLTPADIELMEALGFAAGSTLPARTAIQTDNGTTLATDGVNYYFEESNGSGPALKFGGAAVIVGQWGGWAPTGAIQTSAGYEVAMKNAGSAQYTIWNTDSNGNYTGNAIGIVSGTDPALENAELSFNQDLNGDGHIGSTRTAIQTDNGITLATDGAYYYLDNSSGSGPVLEFNGSPIGVGQWGGWAPIGAIQTSNGFEVAMKNAGSGQYTVWNTDSNGNYTSNAIGIVSGTDPSLENAELTFNQDLNGDGHVGPSRTPIQTDNGTTLATDGTYYYFDNSSGTGPALEYGGAAIVVGQWGGWAPIGTIQTSTGYEVAMNNAGSGQYTIWNTDTNGNYTSNAIGIESGTDASLESAELTFSQDLNGDGHIGPAAAVFAQMAASFDTGGSAAGSATAPVQASHISSAITLASAHTGGFGNLNHFKL